MNKNFFEFDSDKLEYRKINKRFNFKSFIIGFLLGVVFTFAITAYNNTNNDERNLTQLVSRYELVNKQLDHIFMAVLDINTYFVENSDLNVYKQELDLDFVQRINYLNCCSDEEYQTNLDRFLGDSANADLELMSDFLYFKSVKYDSIFKILNNNKLILSQIPSVQPINKESMNGEISGFGMRIHPILKIRRMHYGVDFPADTGVPIIATGNGVIANVRRSKRGYGNYIKIEHGFGYSTIYAHMANIDVNVDENIIRGDTIGTVGSTGLSTGPHLHYEVRRNGLPLNPEDYIIF